MIRLSVKGLAKFMTSGHAAARKVLHDYKYQDDEGRAQAKYYRDAHNRILQYHRGKKSSEWLLIKAGQLHLEASSAPSQQIATRLRSNASAVKRYATTFDSSIYDLLSGVRLGLSFGNVLVTVTPDMHVRANGREKLVRLDFSSQPPKEGAIKIISQTMFEAASIGGMSLKSSQVLYVDVRRGRVFNGARLGARMRRDIEAACQTIEDTWPSL